MSTTLAQYFAERPRLEVATSNLKFNKKLRRLVASTIEKLIGSTSPRDLADKVLKEVTTPTNLTLLYGFNRPKTVADQEIAVSKLSLPIKLCCETFTGLTSKSTFEASVAWQKSHKKLKQKNIRFNSGVNLAPIGDRNRVYVTDPLTEVAIVENVVPLTLLDGHIKDRQKHAKPCTATFIKLDSETVLYLFKSFEGDVQRRIQVPMSRVKNYQFKTLESSFVQDGLRIVPRDLSGSEFDINSNGELVGEKRFGVTPAVYCFDQTFYGSLS